MQDPSRLTATAAAHLIRTGRLAPTDLLEACLARIYTHLDVVIAPEILSPCKIPPA